MLMKALLNRINGGTDTSSTRAPSSHRRFSKLVYEKFPNLPTLIMSLLDPQAEALSYPGAVVLHVQRIFPALEMVERFGLPSQRSQQIKDAMTYHLEGSNWALREKAAKALSLIVPEKELVNEIERLLSNTYRSHNALHGRLLCARGIVRRFQGSLSGKWIVRSGLSQSDPRSRWLYHYLEHP